ncbi:MAG: pentapeptide repeat-containing protein [Cyanobacteria bacterium J06582_2]
MFSFVVISHAINTDLIRDCSIYVWMWIETNKEQLKATGSILSPLAIFMGSVVVQYAINKDNQKIKEKDSLNEQKRIESQNELTKYTTKQNQELTELIAQRDLDSALERLRIEILSSYLDRMTLLLKESQSSEKETRAILGQIAKALTISTLKELDAKRNKIVTTFLYETKLVQDTDNLFDNELNILYEANLENAQLSSSFFKNANLENANLSNANLENANLKNANLRNSTLINANINNASFNDTSLKNSNLRGANLSNIRMQNVNLENAKLGFCNSF